MSAMLTFYVREMTDDECRSLRLRLNEIAAGYGYTATRGATAGQGNAAELLTAIASGEIAPVLLADEERAMIVRWLDEQSDKLETENYLLSLALRSLVKQLNDAVTREREMSDDDE